MSRNSQNSRSSSQNSRKNTQSSIPTYQASLASALPPQTSPPQASTPLASAYQQNTSGYSSPTGYSGIPPVTFGPPGYAPPGSQYTGQYPATQSIPVLMPPPAPSTRITKATTARSRAQNNNVCFDTRYAKSKQGIFKVIQWIISFIAWICIACTPYTKRIFVQGATWPFHMVMFFTIMGWLCVSILYILFTSGYHRRRKRKPWPSYELYFNATMIFWFFTAAMIESFNLWRWNYGPYKEPVNHAGHSAPSTMYGGAVSSNNQHYYQGWDPKLYCRQRPQECHDYMNAVIYYNPYYPTHIFATICLWVIFGVFIGSTYHAYTLHVDYRNFINGVDQTAESVYTKLSSKFTVSRMKKKPATNSKPKSAYSSGTKQKKQKRTTQKTSSSRDEGSVEQPNPVAPQQRPKSVNMSIEV